MKEDVFVGGNGLDLNMKTSAMNNSIDKNVNWYSKEYSKMYCPLCEVVSYVVILFCFVAICIYKKTKQ